jgi:hypothetical protein
MFRSSPIKFLFTGFLTGIIVLDRFSYILLFVLILIYLILAKQKSTQLKLKYVISYLTSALLVLLIGNHLFPQIHIGLLTAFRIPYSHCMLDFCLLKPPHLSLQLFLDNLIQNIHLQISGRGLAYIPYMLIFNFLMISVFFKFRNNENKRYIELHLLVLFNIIVYLVTLVLFHFQTRFLQTLIPFLIISLIISLPERRWKPFYIIFIGTYLLINLGGDILAAKQNRIDTKITASEIRSYQNLRNEFKVSGNILIVNSFMTPPWIFDRSDHLLMVCDNIYSIDELKELRQKCSFSWAILPKESKMIDSLSVFHPKFITSMNPPMEDHALYRFTKGSK